MSVASVVKGFERARHYHHVRCIKKDGIAVDLVIRVINQKKMTPSKNKFRAETHALRGGFSSDLMSQCTATGDGVRIVSERPALRI